METKTSKAIELFRSENIAGSLKIFRTFRIGFSKEERRAIEIAHESMSGNEKFYQGIGIDTSGMISRAREIIKGKYNI